MSANVRLIDMVKDIAENLNILGSDNETINSNRINKERIINKINNCFRFKIALPIIDKFALSFEQITYPKNTNIGFFTADGSSSGTTLISVEEIFQNNMEGYYIQNPTTGEKIKIITYISLTEVTLESAPASSWSGNTCYILGNEFYFLNEIADLREILKIGIKYSNSDQYYYFAGKIRRTSERVLDTRYFSKATPSWYETSLSIGGIQTRGFGILPFPDNYDGALQIFYTQLPKEMVNDNDILEFSVSGVSEAIIADVTAWGAKLLGLDYLTPMQEAQNQIARIVSSFKPRARSGPSYLTVDYENEY